VFCGWARFGQFYAQRTALVVDAIFGCGVVSIVGVFKSDERVTFVTKANTVSWNVDIRNLSITSKNILQINFVHVEFQVSDKNLPSPRAESISSAFPVAASAAPGVRAFSASTPRARAVSRAAAGVTSSTSSFAPPPTFLSVFVIIRPRIIEVVVILGRLIEGPSLWWWLLLLLRREFRVLGIHGATSVDIRRWWEIRWRMFYNPVVIVSVAPAYFRCLGLL